MHFDSWEVWMLLAKAHIQQGYFIDGIIALSHAANIRQPESPRQNCYFRGEGHPLEKPRI